ncbi:hypothetical protein [Variovorax sp. LG9.2]|uniref:hypothetical protein n=1 Tax=Variovorax sp. LG9.2 TaxID=3048626 RepID=UPI002B237D7E|nr:hypothetical protein [Variovorax sp. LG9.2]MEB0060142.1 hypothetical protein [Variovorax sp. LG9.2]
MTTIAAKIKALRSWPIANRNRRHPFELGAVQTRDRIQAGVRLHVHGQGRLLDDGSTLDTGLVFPGITPPGIRSAAAAFRSVQRFFESAAVEKRLAPWQVLGFMSDSLVPNGLAAVLHDEDETVQFINVTAGAFFHTLYSAYHLVSDKRFEPTLPRPGEHLVAHAEPLFGIALNIPVAPERRALAGRFAVAALRVTFFHELAHILRAHTVYLRREAGAGIGAITEVSASDFASSQVIDLRRRALETDADDFSGRFMAKQFFNGFHENELSLENPRFRAKAFEVVVGVVLMYSWFAESEGYHSGSLRAYLVLGSMFVELGLDVNTSARWVNDRVSGLQALMIERGLLPRGVGFISDVKLSDLNQDTFAYRESHMRDWLQLRPWGFNGDR